MMVARHSFAVLCMLLACMQLCAQQEPKRPRYEFVKENGRPKFLKQHGDIEVHLKDSLPEERYTTRHHILEGDLLRTTADSLVIDFRRERWSQRWEGPFEPAGYSPVRAQELTRFVADTTELPRAIALDRIDHITYQRATVGSGAFITVVSALGLLVYAPLKAMKFRTGTFDGEKYIKVATPCLIGVGVGLVVMPFTEGKQRVRVKLGT